MKHWPIIAVWPSGWRRARPALDRLRPVTSRLRPGRRPSPPPDPTSTAVPTALLPHPAGSPYPAGGPHPNGDAHPRAPDDGAGWPGPSPPTGAGLCPWTEPIPFTNCRRTTVPPGPLVAAVYRHAPRRRPTWRPTRRIWPSQRAVSQTVVLPRGPGQYAERGARLDQFGPLAVDPGRRPLHVPQAVPSVPFKGEFWVYDLSDLARPPQRSCCRVSPPAI